MSTSIKTVARSALRIIFRPGKPQLNAKKGRIHSGPLLLPRLLPNHPRTAGNTEARPCLGAISKAGLSTK